MALPSLPQPKAPTPTGDDIEQQLRNQSRIKGIGRVLRKLGLMGLEDSEDIGLENLKVKMQQFPQDVLTGIRNIGRNPDSETFIKSLKPDVDEGGLNTIFGTAPALPPVKPPPVAPVAPPGRRPAFNPFATPEGALAETFKPQQPLVEIIGKQTEAARTIPAEEAIRRIQEQPELPTQDWLDRAGEVAKNPVQLVPFLSTAAEAITLGNINRIANALEAGEAVSETELRLLTEFINKANTDKTWGAKVMDVIAQMPAFAGEIVTTGGIFSGVKAGAQKAGTTALRRLVGRAVEGRAAQLAIRGGAGAAAAGVAAVPPAVARTPAGIQERQLVGTLTGDDEEVWESAIKSFGANWVEAASERTGGALGTLTSPIKGQLMKSALLRSILRLNPGKNASEVNKLFEKFGYNGVFGEMFEERVADVAHGLLAAAGLGDEPFKLPSLEQLSIELAAFAVPGVAAQVASNLPEAIERARREPERGAIGGEEQPQPVVSPEVTPQGVAKEAWQMTKAEFLASMAKEPGPIAKGLRPQTLAGIPVPGPSMAENTAFHQRLVGEALSEGKPVPQSVLADYPELAKVIPQAKPAALAVEPTPQPPQATPRPTEAQARGIPEAGQPPPTEPPADVVSPPPVEPPIDIIPPPVTPAPGERIMGDLQNADELATTMTNPDVFRKLARLPGLRSVLKYLNPAGVAESPAEKAVILRAALREEGQNKAIGAFATLEQLGKRDKVWGKIDDDGRITSGNLEGKLLDEVLTFRTKYAPDMTPEQKAWADQFHAIERDKLDFLKRNGITINELSFEEGGEYVGRRVAGRLDDTGNLVDSAFIGSPGPGRPGSKMGAEKTRQFKDINEAVEQGFRYLPSDEALFLNIKGAYNRVADKQMADWVLGQIPFRTTEVFNLPKASALVRDAMKKQPIKESRLVVLRRDMPEFADKIEDALRITDWSQRYAALQSIRQQLKQVIPTSQAKLFWAVERLAKNRKIVEEGIAAMQRALRGETLPTGTIRAIENVVPQLKGKLREPTRLTLDDLIRSGREAAEYPKILEVPHPGVLAKYKKLLKEAQEKFAANPKDAQLAKEIRRLKAKIGFTKYRMAKAEPLELFKSPKSILTKDHKKALEEVLNILRGEGYDAVTATGHKITKYRGGILKEMRKEELKAIESRKKVAEFARTAHLGEASVQAPAFAGKILTGKEAKQNAETLSRAFTSQYGDLDRILMSVNKANAIGRYFMLAGDASALTIQLIGFSVRFPRIWSKSAVSFSKALFSEKSQAAYLAKNNAIIQKSRNLILTKGGQTEYTEAFRSGGLLSKGPAKLLVPFQRGFEAAMDTAGIELRKAFDHLADTPQHTAEVEQFINEFRGVTSSARIGVSPQLRQFETAVFLAPRYNRAVAALLSDVARGGIRGDQARKAILALIGGSIALAVAVTLTRDEGWEAILDHLNPQSKNFMTWEIAGQRIGPGAKFRSLLALAGKITKEPERTVELTANFVRAQFAPLLSTSIDIINGRDYVGEPTRPGKPLGFGKEVGFTEGMLGLSRRVIADNLLPLSLNSFLMEGGDFAGRVTRGVIGFAGGRAYPSRTDEAKDVIDKAFIQLGKEDAAGLEVALKGVTNAKKIAEIRAKDHTYDITSLRRDISDAIRYIGPKDVTEKNGFNPLAMAYAEFDKVDDEYETLSTKEKEQYVKDNPNYITDRLFWGDSNLRTIPDLKTAEALESKAKQFNMPLDMIPAFQLTDKGKERIPSKRELWKPYFDYNDLPGNGGYLSYSKEQVEAGKLPEEFKTQWETYQKFKTDSAKTAYRKTHKAASANMREALRRKDTDLDKWLQDNEGLKPLTKVSGRAATANRRAQRASSPFSGGFRSVSRRRRIAAPKFPKVGVGTGMSVSAPRAPRA